jgi:methylated-DNA-protein-cysteine methyltransferase-like protein
MELDFKDKVKELVLKIPKGKVTTYGLIAEKCGAKSSSRMVGFVLNSLKGEIEYPCHRVVNRLGILSGKNHFPTHEFMQEMLESEGIKVQNDKVDIQKYLWIPD